MHIVCPHCTTSYAINPATLGEAGRTVRCSRCREVWLARPEDAIGATAPTLAYQSAGSDLAAEWDAMGREEADETPVVESPSISADLPEGSDAATAWPAVAEADAAAHTDGAEATGKRRFHLLPRLFRLPSLPRIPFMPVIGALPTTCAAMAALIIALFVWRNDVVRLLPQTALFYKMVGLDVNLRGEMAFPVADLLIQRGVPFIFTTGYDESVIPDRFANILRCEKPIAVDGIIRALGRMA